MNLSPLQQRIVKVFETNFTVQELDTMFDTFTLETWIEILENINAEQEDDIPGSFGTH